MTPMDRYIDFVLRGRWLVIVLAALVMLATAAGMSGLTVSSSYRVLFGEDNPDLLAFDELQDTYVASRSALIAISPRGGTVFTRDTLAAIEELTETAWQTPYSVRVNSLTNYFHSEAEGDELTIAPLVADAKSFSNDDLKRVRTIALNESELVGQLISGDGRTTGLAISFALPEPKEAAWAEISSHLRDLLDNARATHPDLRYFLTGNVILNQTFTEAAQDDAKKIPIAFLVILAITVLILRSVYATLAIAVLLLFVVLSTLGVAGWSRVLLTPISASVPIIIVTVGVAHAIHIATMVLAGLRRWQGRNAAIRASLSDNLYPVFLTSATTAIGFLSLNMSDSPPFHVLGNLVALGVLFGFVYSVTLLPALFSILPLRARPARPGRSPFFDRLGDFVVAHRALVLWSSIFVVVALATGIPRNELSDNWAHHFDDHYAFRTDTDFVTANLTGIDRLEYSLNSEREGGITDPEYLRTVDAFAEWCRDQPEVHHVQAFTDIMKRVNRNLHGDDPAFYRIPDDAELAAQFLLLYEFSLPFGADLNDRVDIAKSATRMTVVLKETSTVEHLDLDARARNWLEANAPGLSGPASGFTMIAAHMSSDNTWSMLEGTILAAGLISVILLLVFRNVLIGMVCLVPNFIPAVLLFGLWGYLHGNVGLGGSVVVAVAIGVIVDDTIHFMTHYMRDRQKGRSASEAVRTTFGAVGRALGTTTAILVAGFLVFSTSGYEPGAQLGFMVALAITFALLADLLLLPPILMTLDRRKT
ncbi:MAG: MMPL family transporter [Acidobacteriota bacterium]|nr:MMPL family transporter [Acidobacteriota bacterium]